MLLPMCYYGNPILRQKAQPVSAITEEVRQLCRDIVETMLYHEGIGLAAPQVGHLLRIFVSNLIGENEEGELCVSAEPTIYINPILSAIQPDMIENNEGCLSIPEVTAAVMRPRFLHIEALDIEGNVFHEECYGYKARLCLHETDHLNGILFIDHIKGKRRTQLEPLLRLVKQKYGPKTSS